MPLHQRFRTLLLCCFLSLSFFAQRFPSRHFTISNGLPSNAVYCMFKDSRGLMWIGTDAGLVKYDGYKFQTISTRDGLAGNFIRDILEDKKGNLWIACYGDGLSKFDGKKFTNYTTKSGLVHNEIRRLFIDKKQRLWIGTENGLSVLNKHKFENYISPVINKYNQFQVMQFWEEKNELYFLSRTHGYYKAKLDENKLNCYFIGKPYAQFTFFRQGKYKIFSAHRGTYIDSSNYQYPIDSTTQKNISSHIFWDVAFSRMGTLLTSNCVYCELGGLINYKDGKISDISELYGIKSKQLWRFYHDKKEDKIWISTLDNGLFIIDELPEYYKIDDLFVKDAFNDNNKQYLITNEGVKLKSDKTFKTLITKLDLYKKASQKRNYFFKFDELSKIKSFVNFNRFVKIEFSSFVLNSIQCVENKLYVSSNLGLFISDLNGKILDYCNAEVDKFFFSKKNILFPWPEGHYTRISKYKNDEWLIEYLQTNTYNEPKKVNKVVFLKNSSLLSSTVYGLFEVVNGFSKAKRIHLKGIKDQKIRDVCTDGIDKVFVANSSNELVVFQKQNSVFKLIEKIDNSKIRGEIILNIAFEGNRLFILTNRGLNILSKDKVLFRDSEQGLRFSKIYCFKITGNELIIGTDNGTYFWNIEQLTRTKTKPISKLKLDIRPSNQAKNASFNFPSTQNSILIPLKRINLYNSAKFEYYYSFDNKKWNNFDGNSLNFNELESGEYTIYILQRDLFNGLANMYKLFKINKEKPIWRRNWFVILALLLFLTLVSSIYLFNIKRIKSKEKQKAALLKRIAETKLEALQSQMNPHFIFNALTAIQSYVLKSDIDKTLLYMDKFSKLTRQTLEFSSRLQITLLEELEYLSHFCALENMRFGDQVKVQFDAGELDTSKLLIPPLLIQPLVENAFEHGFTNREKAYELHLHFFIENEQLIVQVSDNGEGFETTTLYKPSSKAIHIIKERLSLLDPKLVEQFSIKRSNNQTRVRFALPIVTL
jgi:hypothetical protein